MGALQILREQVQVFHRRADLRMPEDDREAHDVATVLQILGCEGMTEKVEPALRESQRLEQAVELRLAFRCSHFPPSRAGNIKSDRIAAFSFTCVNRNRIFRSSIENGTLRCFLPFPVTGSSKVVEVEVDLPRAEEFIDPASSIEGGAGDGVDPK